MPHPSSSQWIGELSRRQRALVALGASLRAGGYRFITPTPETHRRVNARPENAEARTLRDIFGWSRPFRGARLPPALFDLCGEAGILVPTIGPAKGSEDESGWWTSTVRYSTLSLAPREFLFVHSAFPTDGADAVFFGPDSYRFAALLGRTAAIAGRVADVGCGTGVGGLVVASAAAQLVLADISAAALELAAVNVALAGDGAVDPGAVRVVASNVLAGVDGDLDTVIANPPYLVDPAGRLYRDGGGTLGLDLAVRIVEESLPRLAAGGQLVLYTGTPVIDGQSALADRLSPLLERGAASWRWEELDPDVFGEELERPAYRDVERLAVVALIARKR